MKSLTIQWTTVPSSSQQHINPLEHKGNYSATSNNMKLVHWLLMGGILHLVQWGDWAGCRTASAYRQRSSLQSVNWRDYTMSNHIYNIYVLTVLSVATNLFNGYWCGIVLLRHLSLSWSAAAVRQEVVTSVDVDHRRARHRLIIHHRLMLVGLLLQVSAIDNRILIF